MGNCLVLQEKTVRVMKTDGKIMEYKSPIKVHQVLSEFANHAISDKLPVVKHLHPNADMVQGHLYYLLPLPLPVVARPAKKKKTVRFSDNVVQEAGQATTGVVRIKVVISKRELQAMLGKGGVAADDTISQAQREPSKKIARIDRDENRSPKGWLPALESIPELD